VGSTSINQYYTLQTHSCNGIRKLRNQYLIIEVQTILVIEIQKVNPKIIEYNQAIVDGMRHFKLKYLLCCKWKFCLPI